MKAFGKDMTNIRFGKLTPILVVRKNSKGMYIWLCKCDCGNEKEVRGSELRNGEITHCGCERKVNIQKKDLIGKKFGSLLVINYLPATKKEKSFCMCKCDCGAEIKVRTDNLRGGHTRSCAGQAKLHHKTYFARNDKRERKSWGSMIQRCTNPNSANYKYYGARGITVCERWVNSFENFFADMGARPEKTSLDRINNNGNYEPGNCRWATAREQYMNKRIPSGQVFHEIYFQGEMRTIPEIAKLTGVTYAAAYWKYARKERSQKRKFPDEHKNMSIRDALIAHK